jgi:DNA-binding MarR family transcriptional regulator
VTDWLSDDEQAAWRGLLHMTSRLNARLNRQLQDAHGLSLADYDVLVPLSESPDGRLRVFEISDTLAWEQSRLSHHLARMQRRGLVERQGCSTDRRGAFVVLTGAGRAAITAAAPGHVAMVRQLLFDALTPEQVAMLSDVSGRVLDRLRRGQPGDQQQDELPVRPATAAVRLSLPRIRRPAGCRRVGRVADAVQEA